MLNIFYYNWKRRQIKDQPVFADNLNIRVNLSALLHKGRLSCQNNL